MCVCVCVCVCARARVRVIVLCVRVFIFETPTRCCAVAVVVAVGGGHVFAIDIGDNITVSGSHLVGFVVPFGRCCCSCCGILCIVDAK